jgi:hypothetical protein
VLVGGAVTVTVVVCPLCQGVATARIARVEMTERRANIVSWLGLIERESVDLKKLEWNPSHIYALWKLFARILGNIEQGMACFNMVLSFVHEGENSSGVYALYEGMIELPVRVDRVPRIYLHGPQPPHSFQHSTIAVSLLTMLISCSILVHSSWKLNYFPFSNVCSIHSRSLHSQLRVSQADEEIPKLDIPCTLPSFPEYLLNVNLLL